MSSPDWLAEFEARQAERDAKLRADIADMLLEHQFRVVEMVGKRIDASADRVMKNSTSLANELLKQGKLIEDIASVFADGHDDVRVAHANMSLKFRKLLSNGHADEATGNGA